MYADIWSNMFHLGIPVLEKILRPIIIYVFLIVGLRLAGKHELAQLNRFDLVVLLILSNTVQNAIIGEDNSVTGGIIGAATLFVVNYIVVRFLYRHKRVDRRIEGDSTVLIENGHLRKDRLEKELITMAELESAAHKQGLGSLAEIERAVLEPGGTVTFIAKKPEPEMAHFQEILSRLDRIAHDLAALRASQGASHPGKD